MTYEASDSQVAYGTTMDYVSMSAMNISLVTTYDVALGGLTGAIVYHYHVKSRDAAGNLAVSSDATFTTVDVTPPAISISAPATGATLTGSVTVSATASDNVGVVGVQFQLDGANLGPEDAA